MIIRATQHRQLIRDGVATDYVAAHELPGDKLAAESKDSVEILSANGEILFTSPGQNLETNLAGDVFWTQDGNIEKWSAEKGQNTLAHGYSRFLPGPDGKLFALGFDNSAGESGHATVDLLDADGQLVSRGALPESFHVTGGYISHDQNKALLGGYSDQYFDVYSRPASVFSLEVGNDGQLKMQAVLGKNLNALARKDGQPILLEDGRVGFASQASFIIGHQESDQAHVWDILGPNAAAGGRPVDVADTVAPAATLEEQLAAINPPDDHDYRDRPISNGTPIWAEMARPEGGLVDRTPPVAPPPAPTKTHQSLWSRLRGRRPVEVPVKTTPTIPRLVDPKLGARIKDSLSLAGAPAQAFPTAQVTEKDDQMVVEFATGLVATKKGQGQNLELHLYGPTGDEKALAKPESFSFDAQSASLAIDGTTYDLNTASISNPWLNINQGVMSSPDGSNPVYLGNGEFEIQSQKLKLPLHPEIFSDATGYEKTHASGEVFSRTQAVIGACVSFRSVERIDTMKAPKYAADQSVKDSKEQLLSTAYRVTFHDGRVLEGDESGVKLGGKKVDNSGLLVADGKVTLRREESGQYLVDKPVDSFWNQVGEVIVPGTRRYERVEGGSQVVKRQDLSIAADGSVVLSVFEREQPFPGSPLQKTSEAAARVGDPQIGENFEKVL